MKYAFEMDIVAMIHVSSFIKIGSGIRKLIGGGYTDTQDAWRSHKPIREALTVMPQGGLIIC
jgi:hypothetical protein